MKKTAGLFFLFAVLYALCLKAYYVGFFNDDAFYIIGAKSLLQGRFVELNHPLEPALINYLPGYPLLIAPLCLLFPHSMLSLQIFSIALVLIGLFLTLKLFAGEMEQELALLALIICATNPLTASLSGTVLSELPTFALTPLFFLLVRRYWDDLSPRRLCMLAALAAYAFWLRPTGAVFIGAFTAALLFEKRRKPALLSLVFFSALIAPVLLRNWLKSGVGMTYSGEYLEGIGQGFLSNAGYYLQVFFVEILFRWRSAAGAIIVLGLAVSLAGFYRWGVAGWKKTIPLYIGIYLAVYLLWSKQAGRYLFPLLPLLIPLFFLGAAQLAKRLPHHLWVPRALFAVALFLSFFPLKYLLAASLSRQTALNTPPQNTFSWIREKTRESDIFATELDGRFYLYTQRKAFSLKKGLTKKDFLVWLKENRVNYVVLVPTDFIMRTAAKETRHDPLDPAELRKWLKGSRYKRVFESKEEGAEIYLRGK